MASVSFDDGRAVAERSNVERTRGDGEFGREGTVTRRYSSGEQSNAQMR